MERFRYHALVYCLLLLGPPLMGCSDASVSPGLGDSPGDLRDKSGAVSSSEANIQSYDINPQISDLPVEIEEGSTLNISRHVVSKASALNSTKTKTSLTLHSIGSPGLSSAISKSEHFLHDNKPSSKKIDIFKQTAKEFLSKSDTEEEEGVHEVDYDVSPDLMLGFGEVSDQEDDDKPFKPKTRKKPAFSRIERDRNLMLHEAVRNLLGFSDQHYLRRPRGRMLPDATKEKRLPEYVKDLYRRFQSGEMTAGLVHGNTIRSIHTKRGTVEGEPMFLFNMSSLKPTEKLVNAEIHLYRRRLKPWIRRLELDILLHQVAPHYISQVGKITLRDSAAGWQWYDVTSAVRSCLASGKQPQHLFGLSFRKQRPNGISKPVLLRKFGKHHSMPFLVIYSNETEAVNLSQLDLLAERLSVDKGDDATGEDDLDDSLFDLSNDLNELAASEVWGAQPSLQPADVHQHNPNAKRSESNENSIHEHRKKRSLLTNEIPEDPMDVEKLKLKKKIPKTHPGILQSRQDYREQSSKIGLIPYPESYLQKKRKKAKLRKKPKQNVDQHGKRFPKEWDEVQVPHFEKTRTCDRKKLLVDFADIGWADWIISPKSFEAHYCAGECPFPLTKKLRPSNHATIQSIVHAIGLYDKVPAPCCVPDVMSSITLLYFDEDRNVVLKNYPEMTVESCACR